MIAIEIAIEIGIEIGIDHPGTRSRRALPDEGSFAAQMRTLPRFDLRDHLIIVPERHGDSIPIAISIAIPILFPTPRQ